MVPEKVDGILVKDGFYLEPINSVRIDRDAYVLGSLMLIARYHIYRQNPPLLLPLMRGGGRDFLNVSGSFRRVLRNDSQDIDYVPIKMSRYNPGTIGSESLLKVDEADIMQAFYAIQRHSEGMGN